MTPPEDIVLVLRATRDPQEAPGVPARPAIIRLRLALKFLLRAFGLKCVAVRDRQPADPTEEADRDNAS